MRIRTFAATALALAACGDGGTTGLANQPPRAAAGLDVATVVGMTVRFDGTASSDPDGDIVSYHWDFGDGASAETAVATHAYADAGTYRAVLAVVDDRNARATDDAHVTVTEPPPVNAPPVAEIAGPSQVTVQADFALDGGASRDTDGTISSYSWDFGDGATGSGVRATHRYAAVGAYTAALVVTDDDGATDRAELTIRAVAAPDPIPASSRWSWAKKPGETEPGGMCSFGTGDLTITISGTGATTRPMTVVEAALIGSTTYSGTLTVATRAFSVTNSGMSGTATIQATFDSAYRHFDGTYRISGTCNFSIGVQGTRQ